MWASKLQRQSSVLQWRLLQSFQKKLMRLLQDHSQLCFHLSTPCNPIKVLECCTVVTA